MKVVLVDCGSSSTEELKNSILNSGADDIEVVEPFSRMKKGDIYLFSGRAKKSSGMDRWTADMIRAVRGERALFICYSAELLNLLMGGRLIRAEPVEGFVEVEFVRPSLLWPRAEKVEFYESRAYRISKLGQGLEPLATSKRMGMEAYRFEEFYGVLFHPELSGKNGLTLLSRFLKGRG